MSVVTSGLGSKDVIVRSKFVDSLPTDMVEKMKIQFGHQTEASLNQVVRFVSILEPQYKGRKASETTLLPL